MGEYQITKIYIVQHGFFLKKDIATVIGVQTNIMLVSRMHLMHKNNFSFIGLRFYVTEQLQGKVNGGFLKTVAPVTSKRLLFT